MAAMASTILRAATCARRASGRRAVVITRAAAAPTRFSKPGFAAGLPGVTPFPGPFDPLDYTGTADKNTVKRYREAELTHGRVAMLASVGYLVGEAVEGSSFLFDAQIRGPAIDHFQQVPGVFWQSLVLLIAIAEAYRAQVGWEFPDSFKALFTLKDSYVNGDIGYDPLGLKPSDPLEYEKVATQELNNGRLAMVAVLWMTIQEETTHEGVLQTLGRLVSPASA